MPSGLSPLGQADAGAADRVGDDLDRLVLPDHARVEVGLEVLQALELARDQLPDGDAGARGDDRGDVGLADDPLGRRRLGRVQAGLQRVGRLP